VWIEAQVYEDDLAFLPVEQAHKGQLVNGPEVTATTRAYPNEPFHGKLSSLSARGPGVANGDGPFRNRESGAQAATGSTAELALKIVPAAVPSIVAAIKDEKQKEPLSRGNCWPCRKVP